MFTLGDGAVSWRSVKQSYTTESTMEVEYVVAFKARKEVICLWKFLMRFEVIPLVVFPLILFVITMRR